MNMNNLDPVKLYQAGIITLKEGRKMIGVDPETGEAPQNQPHPLRPAIYHGLKDFQEVVLAIAFKRTEESKDCSFLMNFHDPGSMMSAACAWLTKEFPGSTAELMYPSDGGMPLDCQTIKVSMPAKKKGREFI